MAMSATQQAAAGAAQLVLNQLSAGAGNSPANQIKILANAVLTLALSAGSNTPAISGNGDFPTVLDAAPVVFPPAG
jgi:hypothetical protein